MAVKYVCTKKCFHNLKLYRIGDYAVFQNAKDGPNDKKGKLIYFEPVEVITAVIPEKKYAVGVKVNNQEV